LDSEVETFLKAKRNDVREMLLEISDMHVSGTHARITLSWLYSLMKDNLLSPSFIDTYDLELKNRKAICTTETMYGTIDLPCNLKFIFRMRSLDNMDAVTFDSIRLSCIQEFKLRPYYERLKAFLKNWYCDRSVNTTIEVAYDFNKEVQARKFIYLSYPNFMKFGFGVPECRFKIFSSMDILELDNTLKFLSEILNEDVSMSLDKNGKFTIKTTNNKIIEKAKKFKLIKVEG
jgi:hypothetical protein